MALCCLAWPPGIVVAYPLLAATTRDADPPGTMAPEARGARAQAQGCAAHRAIHACAVVLAVGLEGLAVGVAYPVQDAAHADYLCKHMCRSGQAGWASCPHGDTARPWTWPRPWGVPTLGAGRPARQAGPSQPPFSLPECGV